MDEELSVEQHYGVVPLLDKVNESLNLAGVSGERISWEMLTPLDQFHSRGLAASTELANALGIEKGSTVLDVGCGIGGSARFLAATYGVNVNGIDLTQSFVDVATALSKRTGLEGMTTFQQADALNLPFPDNAFDIAWTQHVAMNIAARAEFYSEIHRVLKPGGRLGIHDIVSGNGEPLIFPVPWARIPEISYLLTAEEMRNELVRAGFSIDSLVDETPKTLAWLEERRRAAAEQNQPSPLSLNAVMGPEFPVMIANLGRNLMEGRVGVAQVIARKH